MLVRAALLVSVLCVGLAMAGESSPRPTDQGQIVLATNTVELLEANTLAALAADLQRDDHGVRRRALQKLGQSTDPESKRILMERFKGMPQPKPSSESNQREKTEVLKALCPKLGLVERVPLFMDTLRQELSAFSVAEKGGNGLYYPSDLLLLTIGLLQKEGISEEMRKELGGVSSDESVPRHIRPELLAVVLIYDMEKGGVRTPEEKARSCISAMPVRPNKRPIPWDIAKDEGRRNAFAKTDTYRRLGEETAAWLRSDEGCRNEAYEKVLYSLGFVAVEQLAASLDKESVPKDKRDYLAMLAAEILRERSSETKTEAGSIESFVEVLARYVDAMPDAGQFSRRARAAAALNVYYKNAGLSKVVEIIKDTGRATGAGAPIKE